MVNFTDIQELDDDASICVSKHAYERLRERNGWNRKTCNRMISRIYESGVRSKNVKGYLHIWLKNHIEDNCEYVIYGQNLFVFSNKILVTAYPVPNKSWVRNCCY